VRVHINSLIDGSAKLDNYQILVFIGGFGWGDDHGAGVIQAVRMKTRIGQQLIEFVDKGNLVLGICNGFQALVNLGLLPGLTPNNHQRSVALTFNDCGNFRDQWVALRVNPASPCVFTHGIELAELPVRHGEGKFFADDASDGAPANGRFPFNPNGSVDDIAGICDATGRIFGLMPHPEGYNHPTNHPDWTRRKEIDRRRGHSRQGDIPVGIRILQNGVEYVRTE